jgi:hypothetical protein
MRRYILITWFLPELRSHVKRLYVVAQGRLPRNVHHILAIHLVKDPITANHYKIVHILLHLELYNVRVGNDHPSVPPNLLILGLYVTEGT